MNKALKPKLVEVLSEKEFVSFYRKYLLGMQDDLKKEKQTELPLVHDFSPGLYIRTIFMPAGTFVIGKTHKTEHFNIVHSGRANVMIDGEYKEITAPDMFVSKAGIKKVLWIFEDMTWSTTHPVEDFKYFGWKFWKWGSKIPMGEWALDKLESLLILPDHEERLLINNEVKKLL